MCYEWTVATIKTGIEMDLKQNSKPSLFDKLKNKQVEKKQVLQDLKDKVVEETTTSLEEKRLRDKISLAAKISQSESYLSEDYKKFGTIKDDDLAILNQETNLSELKQKYTEMIKDIKLSLNEQNEYEEDFRKEFSNYAYCQKSGKPLYEFSRRKINEISLITHDKTSTKLYLTTLIHPIWLNTSPDNLMRLLLIDPIGFFIYSLDKICEFDDYFQNYNIRARQKSVLDNSEKFIKVKQMGELYIWLEQQIFKSNNTDILNLILLICDDLRKIISIANVHNLQMQLRLGSYQDLQSQDLLELLQKDVLKLKHELLMKITAKGNTTPYLIAQKRKKLSGNSSYAQTFSISNKHKMKRWLGYIANYDKSFAYMITDELLNYATLDMIEYPEGNKLFTDVKITDNKVERIKAKLEKIKRKNKFMDILNAEGLGEIE